MSTPDIYPPTPTGAKPRWPHERRLALIAAVDAAKRGVHAAQAHGDADAEDAAIVAHAAAIGELEVEQQRLAESWRLHAHAALTQQPDEIATWLANLIELPEIQAYYRDWLVAQLATLLAPTVDHLSRRCDSLAATSAAQERRIAALETLAAAEVLS